MQIKRLEPELKARFGELKRAEKLDLRNVDTNIIFDILEQRIRELKRLK